MPTPKASVVKVPARKSGGRTQRVPPANGVESGLSEKYPTPSLFGNALFNRTEKLFDPRLGSPDAVRNGSWPAVFSLAVQYEVGASHGPNRSTQVIHDPVRNSWWPQNIPGCAGSSFTQL